MKKILKYFTIIIVNLIILSVLTEVACYYKICINYAINRFPQWTQCSLKNKIEYLHNTFHHNFLIHNNFDKTYLLIKNTRFRKPLGLEYKNKPILLMGCSYAYGYLLEDNQTFAYKLSKLTKRPVYNRAFEWFWGLATMLYQARRADFYKEVPEPEYVIYVFIDDHIRRMNTSCYDCFFPYPHLRYKLNSKNRLEREKFSFLYQLYTFRLLTNMQMDKISPETSSKLVKEFFMETRQEFDKHWKNYKFIILVYEYSEEFNDTFIEELRNEGFIVLKTKDITGRVMNKKQDFAPDNWHPSESAWDEITEKFINKIPGL